MPKVSTGLVIEQGLMQALEDWAQAEYRSRNRLIEMILFQAVEQRARNAEAAAPAPVLTDRPTPLQRYAPEVK